MDHHEVEEIDYMADEVDVLDFVMDDVEADGVVNHVAHDFDVMVTDTSSAQARKGKDIQGIPWDRLNITRESYRRTRLEQYRNYENIPLSGDAVDKNCKQKQKGGNYYEFFHNTRLVKPTILHFQLRNLVWATSKHDVYLMSNYSLMHWSSSSHNLKEILNFSGHVAPTEFVGRFYTDSDFWKRGRKMGKGHGFQLGTVGALGLSVISSVSIVICNKALHSSLSPDRKLIAVVGDHLNGLVVDSSNGKTVASVEGHLDYSFASAWHPDGRVFATGNQDKTCRVWDLRNLSEPVSILKGNMGAVRSVRFSSNGQFLVVAEPADFVHVYETNKNYEKRQEIDFFGEISGVSLSPDDETLYVGVWDRTYASLLQYNRRHKYGYLDAFV
ncbi:WD40/YVTN repeat-like-containing domain-containing protein [Artemisia annua]|uniref:WD40/YVTN repeat-like-containing domain-containing protein n=1 Tax=Artemisia annua TaxID=35608 RepID=A0A2U1NBH3_ARTAN|nr:WD40/YVTN repeat-like-containing domain-containing protein [Artemisia annua]